MARSDLPTRALRAANELTARWVETLPPDQYAVSGACIWPLLALLQAGASGAALEELTIATGVSPQVARAAGLAMIGIIDTIREANAALGLWVQDGVRLEQKWARKLPDGVVSPLARDPGVARAALDRWARDNTDEMINELPVAVTAETLLVLATALFTRFSWLEEFRECRMRFRGHDLLGLHATTSDLSRFAIVGEGIASVGRFTTVGEGEIDVHLLSGSPDMGSGDVLRAGIDALSGDATVRTGEELVEGDTAGCLKVRMIDAVEPVGVVNVPAFEVTSHHDLTASPQIFGITSALDRSRAHFPGIALNLAVGQAGQTVVARFHRRGFEATAVTAISVTFGAAPELHPRVKLVEMMLDRPFGFLAVHRSTRLVLFAGWVTAPAAVIPSPLDDPFAELRPVDPILVNWRRQVFDDDRSRRRSST